jgi:hypothetical protein
MLAGCRGANSFPPAPLSAQQSDGTQSSAGALALQNRFDQIRLRLTPHRPQKPSPSFFSKAALGKPLIFLADTSNDVVDIYVRSQTNELVGQISGLSAPVGVATDVSNNVYIGDSDGTVPIYAPPYTGMPALTLSDSGYFPQNVAVSLHGIVAVANFCSAPSCGAGNVTIYAKGSATACTTITDAANFPYIEGDTFDRSGNLFIDGANPSGHTNVGEISGGCNATTVKLINQNTTAVGGGIHVDRADRLAIFDALPIGSGGPEIRTYLHPHSETLGDPISVTMLNSTHGYCVEDFAFLPLGSALFVADYCNGAAEKYAYPTGGTASKSIPGIPGYAPADVAVTPPLVP